MSAATILGVQQTAPDFKPPPGSCDCHTHVFGPPEHYTLDPKRTYTPGEASAEALLGMQQALGLDRVVIVQPSVYGTDNRCTLDAVRTLGTRARAVAVVSPHLGEPALRDLHAQGVRGIRLNLQTGGHHEPAEAGHLIQNAARHVAGLGWHLQIFTNLHVIAALHQSLKALPIPLVIDHFGGAMAAAGAGQPGFAALLDLVESGKAFVKLSAAHRIAARPDDAGPIATALIAANPERMLWGSDWPHTAAKPHAARQRDRIEPFDPIDNGQALTRLRRWARDEATLHAILVGNPARLYDFPASAHLTRE